MDFTWIKDLSPQVATLVVLFLIVRSFLSFSRATMALIERMNDDGLAARKHSAEVIEKNTDVISENTEVCREMTSGLKDLGKNCALTQAVTLAKPHA